MKNILSPSDREHLRFIYARLISVHGESPNFDYMHELAKIAGIPSLAQSNYDNYLQSQLEGKHP